jgi:hypothetical protein
MLWLATGANRFGFRNVSNMHDWRLCAKPTSR